VISDLEASGAGARPAGAALAALQQATHATLHDLAARLEHLGLTASELNVLAVLADGQVRSVGEIAAASGTRPTTLTTVLDRLERSGRVGRDVDFTDRRSVLVKLTRDGRQAAADVRAAIAALERSALAGISKQQLNGFFAVTSALTSASR
jgi:MarR family transcriptional regulator, organic hydroperoxide resistance regulator